MKRWCLLVGLFAVVGLATKGEDAAGKLDWGPLPPITKEELAERVVKAYEDVSCLHVVSKLTPAQGQIIRNERWMKKGQLFSRIRSGGQSSIIELRDGQAWETRLGVDSPTVETLKREAVSWWGLESTILASDTDRFRVSVSYPAPAVNSVQSLRLAAGFENLCLLGDTVSSWVGRLPDKNSHFLTAWSKPDLVKERFGVVEIRLLPKLVKIGDDWCYAIGLFREPEKEDDGPGVKSYLRWDDFYFQPNGWLRQWDTWESLDGALATITSRRQYQTDVCVDLPERLLASNKQ